MRKLGYSFLLILIPLFSGAQVITSDPGLPLENSPVTIIFDATKGSGGLQDYTGDIYAHTGVVTDSSKSGSDWRYVKTSWGENTPETKLNPVAGENNLYKLEITPDIRSYYGVPEDEKILQIAMVFRSSQPYSGTSYYEGKDTGGKDIYLDVFEEGLNVSIISPADALLEEALQDISFEASSTQTALLSLYLNSSLVKTLSATTIRHVFNFENSGDYWLKVTAENDVERVADSVFVHILAEQPEQSLPEGMTEGINYSGDTEATLVLYAPWKEHVFLIGDFNQWTPSSVYRMNRDGDRYWISLNSLIPGKEYAFQYLVDGELRIADPYADKILDPWNDKWIEEETYPDLKSYPDGLTDGIVSVLETGQPDYEWQYEYNSPEKEQLVIYELLLRDFIENHDWKTLTDTLNYFTELGVNALEIMPFNEFEGNESWGYNPSFYFAPDKYYGPEEDLKAFIDSCHNRGIGVIMDMVLNHSYGQSPLVRLYWDDQNSRPAANNPWYNVSSPNPIYSWGYDFNHESQHTRDFVDRVNRYWISEYHIDGFRFDFTKGFTNTPGEGWNYDASRIAVLKRMADSIWSAKPDTWVILEHFSANTEEKELSDYGMMIWGNMNYNYNEATMGYHENNKSDFGGVSWIERQWNDPHLVGYMESHDEERIMVKNLEYGSSLGDYSVKDPETALSRVELAAVFFIPVPGPKMIWQFGEMGYDISINYNGRVGNKPIRWDYYNSRPRIRKVFSVLNKLKTTEPAFSTSDFSMNTDQPLKTIKLNHEDMDVRIIGNFDLQPGSVSPDFSKTGTWYELFTGEELMVSDLSMEISLEAGEYRLYTPRKISIEELPTSAAPFSSEKNPGVWPNPVKEKIYIFHGEEIQSVRVMDLSGRIISRVFLNERNPGINLSHLKKGMYILGIQDHPGDYFTTKIIKL